MGTKLYPCRRSLPLRKASGSARPRILLQGVEGRLADQALTLASNPGFTDRPKMALLTNMWDSTTSRSNILIFLF
jgi:hypothetical protein